jgi:hypothetical protein
MMSGRRHLDWISPIERWAGSRSRRCGGRELIGFPHDLRRQSHNMNQARPCFLAKYTQVRTCVRPSRKDVMGRMTLADSYFSLVLTSSKNARQVASSTRIAPQM